MTFTVKGVRVRIGFLFFAVAAVLMCFSPDVLLRLAVPCAVLHEAGHLAALLFSGDRPREVGFGPFGLTVVRGSDVALDYRREIFAALCGPAVNFLLCLIFLLVSAVHASDLLLSCMGVNLFLGLFNLLPIFGLDGGRALESFLLLRFPPETAERVLRAVSVGFLLPLTAAGFYVLIRSGCNFTLLLPSLYLLSLLLVRCRT